MPNFPTLRLPLTPPLEDAATALRVVNKITALVSYWDANERCVFANHAYREWFGRDPNQMPGLALADLLGPAYEANVPYIHGVLGGELQVFERQLLLPGERVRDVVATYTPDIVAGAVMGFSAHICDVTRLRKRESALAETIRGVIQTLEKTKDSFRSKDLGELRQRLGIVLTRLEGP